MKKNSLALYSLQIENVHALLTESEASELAKKLGLHHSGWGYYKNSDGLTVAQTIKGKLVKLNGQEFDVANHQANEKDSAKADIAMGELALTKAMNGLIDYAGLEIDVNDPEYGALKRIMINMAENPDSVDPVVDVPPAVPNITDHQLKLANKYFTHLSDTPESPIMQAMKGYKAAHYTMNEPDESDAPPKAPTSLNLKLPRMPQISFLSNHRHGPAQSPMMHCLDIMLPYILTIKYLRDPTENYLSELTAKYGNQGFLNTELNDIMKQLVAMKKALWTQNIKIGGKPNDLTHGQYYGQYFDPSPFVTPYHPTFSTPSATKPANTEGDAYKIASAAIPDGIWTALNPTKQSEIINAIDKKCSKEMGIN
jgi:hypothetical protein